MHAVGAGMPLNLNGKVAACRGRWPSTLPNPLAHSVCLGFAQPVTSAPLESPNARPTAQQARDCFRCLVSSANASDSDLSAINQRPCFRRHFCAVNMNLTGRALQDCVSSHDLIYAT